MGHRHDQRFGVAFSWAESGVRRGVAVPWIRAGTGDASSIEEANSEEIGERPRVGRGTSPFAGGACRPMLAPVARQEEGWAQSHGPNRECWGHGVPDHRKG